MRGDVRGLLTAACLAALSSFLVPSAASAAFSVSGFSATTVKADDSIYTQAGGVPDRGITTTTFSGNPLAGEVIRNLRVDVPPGVITSIASVPTCDNAIAATVPDRLADRGDHALRERRRQPAVHRRAAPALQHDAAAGPDLRVRLLAPDEHAREDPGRGPLERGLRDVLRAQRHPRAGRRQSDHPVDHADVLRQPGRPRRRRDERAVRAPPDVLRPAVHDQVTAQAWNGAVATATDTTPTGATGCDQVPFSPSLSVTPSTTQRDSPAGADVTVNLPDVPDPAQIGQSHVRDTAVTLPEGMTINPSVANGLQTCSDAQFGKGTTNPVACPDAAKVGTSKIVSAAVPLPLTGSVWLGEPQPGNQYRLFLQATGAGVDTRLIGSVTADPQTGRLTTTFADTPQTPFTEFTISMTAGPRAVFATPLACGPGQSTSTLTPWSGQANGTPSATTAPFDSDGAGGACSGTPFAPGFAASTSSTLAAGDTSFTAGVTRPDGQQFLSRLSVTQPTGLVGRIPLVPQCSDAAASAGTCGDASRVGTASVLAGAGSDPFPLSGPAYLTGPYKGAPFGLAMVIRAIAGPYDLGTVIVRAGITINPLTAAITVDSDALPTILGGIPLRLREVKVTVDRQGFLINGTACGPQTASGSSTSTTGASSAASATVQVTACDRLAFTPTISAITGGRPTRKRGASLFVTVAQPAGQVNIRQVSVQLPKGYSARGTTVSQACLRTTFDADPSKCPAASRVGTANAATPTLPFQLPGTAYLVARNAALPTLEVLLSKDLVNLHLSSLIAFDKRYISTFQNLPDVPVTTFQLDQPQGPSSSLAWQGSDICSRPLSMPTTFVGWDGRKLSRTARLTAVNCPVKIRAVRGLRGGRARVTLRIPSAGKLTLSGKGLRTTVRTFTKAASAATVTVLRSSPSVRSATVRARFVPTAAKKAQASSPVPLTPSVSTATVLFPAAAAPRPVFTG